MNHRPLRFSLLALAAFVGLAPALAHAADPAGLALGLTAAPGPALVHDTVVYTDTAAAMGRDGVIRLRADRDIRLRLVTTASDSQAVLVARAAAPDGWQVGLDALGRGSLTADFSLAQTATPGFLIVSSGLPDQAGGEVLRLPIAFDRTAPSVVLGPLVSLGQGSDRSYQLSWRESDGDGAGVARRLLTGSEATAGPAGCHDWHDLPDRPILPSAPAGQDLAPAPPRLTPVAPAAPVETNLANPAGAIRLVSAPAILPAEDDAVLADLVPDPSDASGAAALGQVSLPDISPGHCYRFGLRLIDAVDFLTDSSTVSFLSGALGSAGRPLPDWHGAVNVYRASAFATQQTFDWCVAASTQMMVSMVRRRPALDDRASQAAIIAYAQAHDVGDHKRGTDVVGWVAALEHFGAGRYRVALYDDYNQALHDAVRTIRLTGRPVGLIVNGGIHAWVLNGAAASTDPAVTPDYTVSGLFVTGPLFPIQQRKGYDLAPNTRLTPTELGTYFRPYDQAGGSWAGKYVMVVPEG